MESRTHLDYALFQLTPTRTRCDLVIYGGSKKEKIATGLLEPFISHLKYAKDQISKGGYSITLLPPTPNSSCFTKSTLQRFVKFVSSPEILERFVTIEREIEQIDISIQLNELNNGAALDAEGASLRSSAASTKIDSDGNGDVTQEKNSKVQLLRVLETRKAVLRKEQAMAYARALVAGFEIDNLEDLILFSDAFGAARLREACISFIELCNKKSNDGMWIDEVAAMQASHAEFSLLGTSGILLAGDGNDGSLYNRQHNGQADTSASDSATSLGSLDANLDNNHLPKIAIEQSTERKAQVPPWGQYVHNFQGPGFQKMHPYQGYFFPGMQQVPQSYYPANVQWPPNGEDGNFSLQCNDSRKRMSSKRKDKSSKGTRQDTEQNDTNESSQSSSASDPDKSEDRERRHTLDQLHTKKSGKSSSRKVVIRNINYITRERNGERSSGSESDDSSDDDEFIDADSLKQQVDEALGSLDRRHKSNSSRNKKKDVIKKQSNELDDDTDKYTGKIVPEGETRSQNWDFFQDLLLKDADSRANDTNATEKLSSFNVGTEEVPKRPGISVDSFLSSERDMDNHGRNVINFEAGENDRGVIKRANAEEELLFSQRIQGSEIYSRPPLSDSGIEPSIMKSRREEDWIVGNRPDESLNRGNDTSVFTSETLRITENKKELVDDSFMVQGGLMGDRTHSEPKSDIFLESDISGSNYGKPDDLQDKVGTSNAYEPDDLYMVLGRDSAAEEVSVSWNPEMDYVNNNSVAEEGPKTQSDIELSESVDLKKLSNGKSTNNITGRSPGGKFSNKQAKPTVGSLSRSKSEVISRNKKVPGSKTIAQKSKAEQEEEKRRKMEELLIQRQKRIAERSGGGGGGSTAVASRMIRTEIKKAPVSAKNAKIIQSPTLEERKKSLKPVFRSSTTDRLSAARTMEKQSSTGSSKVGKKTETIKANAKRAASVPKNGPQKKKLDQEKAKASDKKLQIKNSNGYSVVSETPERDDKLAATTSNQKDDSRTKSTSTISWADDSEVIKKLDRASSSQKDQAYKESDPSRKDLPEPAEAHSAQRGHLEANLEVISKPSFLKETIVADENNVTSQKLSVSPKVPITETSTPPPNIEPSAEPNHSRKKWSNGESYPEATKGFRKLLHFGRKS